MHRVGLNRRRCRRSVAAVGSVVMSQGLSYGRLLRLPRFRTPHSPSTSMMRPTPTEVSRIEARRPHRRVPPTAPAILPPPHGVPSIRCHHGHKERSHHVRASQARRPAMRSNQSSDEAKTGTRSEPTRRNEKRLAAGPGEHLEQAQTTRQGNQSENQVSQITEGEAQRQEEE